jgi:hypothetical protein
MELNENIFVNSKSNNSLELVIHKTKALAPEGLFRGFRRIKLLTLSTSSAGSAASSILPEG